MMFPPASCANVFIFIRAHLCVVTDNIRFIIIENAVTGRLENLIYNSTTDPTRHN